ncbi:3-deoxy-manno-octulosonate cytidylyltransferase [Algihabitans albus]|uniref:3-deoxy-manno-octulosonate cytidylyltransferase n=1 Tax=Algihabitans albus TaxID=2164067 RepID=UPI000E5D6ABC|nr:3-deoxy-manno-octulosonate cytidylyltransferase [Algihabitans albus]
MALPQSPLVLIPARLASTRLPDKPLADICGEPMILHVWRRAVKADIGPVAVAAAEPEIVAVIEAAGGQAVLTDPDHPSGSDRIFEALQKLDPEGRVDAVVNVQCDVPTLEPAAIRAVIQPLAEPAVDIGTIAAEIVDAAERSDPNVVKAAVAFPDGQRIARALYFSRAPVPWDGGDATRPLYHHIGLYAFRRAALERFVELPHGPLEQREKLEQLRAMEAGLRIDVALVDTSPLTVDTPTDLERARSFLSN